MGLLATGSSAFGMSLGDEVKVVNEAPGPHSMTAWKPGEGSVACGIVLCTYAEGALGVLQGVPLRVGPGASLGRTATRSAAPGHS